MNDFITALAAAAPLASGWAWHGVAMRRRLAAARRDPLSGLPTRAAFERRAERALSRGPHVVIVMDLDGFKHLNDVFGHAAGDAAIRATAASLTGAAAWPLGLAGMSSPPSCRCRTPRRCRGCWAVCTAR